MSLEALAHKLQSHGRHGDTMLAHINPEEAALLKAHGGSGTINPDTGLREYWGVKLGPVGIGSDYGGVSVGNVSTGDIVNKIASNPVLAAAAGLALDAYLPGVGSAVGGAFGLGGAAGAGIAVGGISALSTGSLQKGIMAGLGAYGGASVGQGLNTVGSTGANAAAQNAAAAADPSLIGSDLEQVVASRPESMLEGLSATAKDPMATLSAIGSGSALKGAAIAATPFLAGALGKQSPAIPTTTSANPMIRPYEFTRNSLAPKPGEAPSSQFGSPMVSNQYAPGQDTSERRWFDQYWTPRSPYPASDVSKYASGGPIEQMSQANSVGANTGYPMADIPQGGYATPWQTPISRNVVQDDTDTSVDSFSGEPVGMAAGGLGSLGGYSDGGRMLKGPGDGMSDDIPATIGGKRPARLADGEFVVPADVVSHLGNGSTDAGARQLYKMMDRVRQQRTGKKKQAPQVNPTRAMPV